MRRKWTFGTKQVLKWIVTKAIASAKVLRFDYAWHVWGARTGQSGWVQVKQLVQHKGGAVMAVLMVFSTKALAKPLAFILIYEDTVGIWTEAWHTLVYISGELFCCTENRLMGASIEAGYKLGIYYNNPGENGCGLDQLDTSSIFRSGQILDLFSKCSQQYLLLKWMWGMKEREKSRMTPRFGAWAIGRMKLTLFQVSELGCGRTGEQQY